MQVAALLVGNSLELIKDADSTKIGIEKTLEYNTDTLTYFDETSNNKEFQDVIHMIGNEQGKNRRNKDGEIDKAGKWKTKGLCCIWGDFYCLISDLGSTCR